MKKPNKHALASVLARIFLVVTTTIIMVPKKALSNIIITSPSGGEEFCTTNTVTGKSADIITVAWTTTDSHSVSNLNIVPLVRDGELIYDHLGVFVPTSLVGNPGGHVFDLNQIFPFSPSGKYVVRIRYMKNGANLIADSMEFDIKTQVGGVSVKTPSKWSANVSDKPLTISWESYQGQTNITGFSVRISSFFGSVDFGGLENQIAENSLTFTPQSVGITNGPHNLTIIIWNGSTQVGQFNRSIQFVNDAHQSPSVTHTYNPASGMISVGVVGQPFRYYWILSCTNLTQGVWRKTSYNPVLSNQPQNFPTTLNQGFWKAMLVE